MGNYAAVKRHRRKVAEAIRQLKRRPCADCGIEYPYYVMHFDHVKGVKEFELSKVTQTNIALARAMAEAEKCDVVCANCHAERTHKRKMEACESGNSASLLNSGHA